jgi:hypothetical protein
VTNFAFYLLACGSFVLFVINLWLTSEIVRVRANNAALLRILSSQRAPEAAEREREAAAAAERRRR